MPANYETRAMRHYETAMEATAAAALPGGLRYQRVKSWDTKRETCAACRRAPAVHLDNDRALCASCHNPALEATRAQLTRSQSLIAAIAREAETRGIIGCAAPYHTVTWVKPGVWETLDAGCFTERECALTTGHDGPVVATARILPARDALFFEADLHYNPLVRGVSIAFDNVDVGETPYPGGMLRRVRRGILREIALITSPDVPAYTTWTCQRNSAAYARVYAGMMAHFAELCR